MVRGRNLWMPVEGDLMRLGFYTTRVVDQPDAEGARRVAIDDIRQRLAGYPVRNVDADPYLLQATETEVLADGGDEAEAPGFSFYPDTDPPPS